MKENNKGLGKRKRLIIIICSIVGACILVGALSYAYVLKPGPDDIIEKYMSYINTKDYEKMYDLLSSDSQKSISKEEFINRNKKIYEGIEAKNVNVQVTEISDYHGEKAVTYETNMETIASKLKFQNKAVLSKNEKNRYCINWDSKIIFPNLDKDDKVKVNKLVGVRGSILDRNGEVLAARDLVLSVGLIPGKIENSEEAIKKTSEILNIPEDTIKKNLNKPYVKKDSFVPLKLISKDETEMKNKLLDIKGVMITSAYARVYPLGESAAHLTGYVKNINSEELKKLSGKNYNENSEIGKIGLEKLLEDRIRGIDGCSVDIVDKKNNKKLTLTEKPAHNGENVKLTIDSKLQVKLYDQLKNDKSSTVVMNPKTGEILALISTPGYDPNEFVLGMSDSKWKELNEGENKPMYNRFKAAFCPGSSFKPITAAIGLTSGKLTSDENLGYSGLKWKKDSSWGGYEVTTLKDYGKDVVLKNALTYSDNIYFAKAALKIGGDTLAKELLNIGFSEAMPFEFGLTPSVFGKDNKFSSEIKLADSGYGQGDVLVNPVHMASMYSAFINEGSMVKPYLEYKDKPTAELWKKNVFSKEAASTVTNDLINVVEDPNGTGHAAMTKGITIAGKTGTAEIKASKDDNKGTELGWFVAFTADKNSDKQYLALTMVEDVKNRGGSHYVIPIVKSVFQE